MAEGVVHHLDDIVVQLAVEFDMGLGGLFRGQVRGIMKPETGGGIIRGFPGKNRLHPFNLIHRLIPPDESVNQKSSFVF